MFPMTFLFLGGRLAVDLLNTVIARDLLGRREDVAAWGEAAGVVARRELRGGGREPADLRAFREALRRGLVAWAAAGTPPARLIALLNHHLARDPAVTEVSRKGRDVVTRVRSAGGPIERLYAAVAPRSARSTSAAGRSRTGRRLRPGQPHGERAARAGSGVDRDVAALQLGEQSRDGEAQAAAAEIAAARLIHPEKPVEDPLHVLGGDAGPRVAHAHADLGAVGLEPERDGPARRVAHGVRAEVEQHVARASGVAQGPARRG